MAQGTCSLPGCEGGIYAKSLCGSHYQKARLATPGRPKCSADDCARVVYSQKLALCRSHYSEAALPGYWKARAADPERAAAHQAARDAWMAGNRDRHNATTKRWRNANPEQARVHARAGRHRRRARMYATAIGPVDFEAVLDRHGMVCHLCLSVISSRADLHFDHVIPLALGGPHVEDNIRPSHARCNLRKGARMT